LRPDTPDALRDAIERAMMKAPEDRWSSAAALRDALTSDRSPSPSWRLERREPVRYASPRPASGRLDLRGASPRRGTPAAAAPSTPIAAQSAGTIVLEPPHLVSLTPAQRADLQLWHGRVHLLDRVKAMRGYTLLTVASVFMAMAAIAASVDVAPLALAPIVPIFMSVKLRKRGRSLRESGLKLRRVLFSLRARSVIPGPPPDPTAQQLAKLAPREVIDSPRGAAIRRAAADRAAIVAIVRSLSKHDRAQLPEVEPTASALVERVVQLAEALHRFDQSLDLSLGEELDARIGEVVREGASPEGERQLVLLRRQRETLDGLVRHRGELARQLDSAGLALGNLRLDLVKLRSSGLQSGFTAVSSATREARALAHEIDIVVESVGEARRL
jgi:hypothetical protein